MYSKHTKTIRGIKEEEQQRERNSEACRTNGKKHPQSLLADKEKKNENTRVIVLFHSIRVYLCVRSVCGVMLKIKKKKKTKKKRRR